MISEVSNGATQSSRRSGTYIEIVVATLGGSLFGLAIHGHLPQLGCNNTPDCGPPSTLCFVTGSLLHQQRFEEDTVVLCRPTAPLRHLDGFSGRVRAASAAAQGAGFIVGLGSIFVTTVVSRAGVQYVRRRASGLSDVLSQGWENL
jgi:hypothetical protein